MTRISGNSKDDKQQQTGDPSQITGYPSRITGYPSRVTKAMGTWKCPNTKTLNNNLMPPNKVLNDT